MTHVLFSFLKTWAMSRYAHQADNVFSFAAYVVGSFNG